MATVLISSSQFPNDINAARATYLDAYTYPGTWIGSNWAADQFIGSGIPNQALYQQSLVDDNSGGFGSTTLQCKDGKIGMFLNGFSTACYPTAPQWSFAITNRNMPTGVRPWTNGRRLHVSVQQHIHTCNIFTGAVIYTYIAFFVKDLVTNKIIVILYHTWSSASSGIPGPSAQYSEEPEETGSGPIPFGSVGLGFSNDFMTNYGHTYQSGSGVPKDSHFWFSVDGTQLQNLLAYCRGLSEFSNLSTNSANYEMMGLSIQSEISSHPRMDRVQGNAGITVVNCEINVQ